MIENQRICNIYTTRYSLVKDSIRNSQRYFLYIQDLGLSLDVVLRLIVIGYRLTRTLRTVLRLSLRMLTVTLTSSPCVYQPLSRLALRPTRPSCSRNGLSTAPWGPPQGPTLMPPMPPVTPALLWGGSISEPVLSQCCQGINQTEF